jgi:TatD DNase family protein
VRLYDSHCHLDFEAFDADRDEVVARARGAGVRAILVPGYDVAQWERLPGLRERFPEVRVAVGLHPFAVARDASPRGLADALAERAVATRAVAIGECGVDARIARRGGPNIATQRAILDVHLEVARALGLPVVLHAVHAHGAMLDALSVGGPLRAGGVLHGFTGPAELVPRYLSLGLSFGFGAAVGRPRAKRPKEAARVVPIERLLVETDSPDMGVQGRNEPAFVAHVVSALAEVRREPETWLAERSYENAVALFRAGDRVPAEVC